jgi:hypothetical protein
MPNFAPLRNPTRNLKDALAWLSARGFQISPPASAGETYTVSKDECVAEIESTPEGGGRIVGFPACIVGGEPALLVDHGYQKFLKTSKTEIAATAEHLERLHRFSEELKEALGYTSLYNEGLGSVSASYQYDRVASRDLPEEKRPIRPWEK